MKNYYVTTTLPYVNDRPHVGHALEFVQADCLARALRLDNSLVFFNTGTDEHGQKIYQKAREEGKDPQVYVDYFANEFEELLSKFNISNDAFIRTSSDSHKQAVLEMWRRCEENGDIYKKSYTGLYCVGCEMFITEKDLVDGKCPDHNREPEEVEEENYFFRFSRYEQPLLDYLDNENTIIPDHHRQWAINFIEGGLEDFSISRQRDRLPWGIEVPDDPGQIMYVWFDALTNYISTLGWPSTTFPDEKVVLDKPSEALSEEGKSFFNEFWNEGLTIQMAGKDQVRMQSMMWQAMLMSAGIEPTNKIFYHGFINSGGKKMSKSIGNVIDPFSLIDTYGTDALRYYLLRHIHPTDDSDLTVEKFSEIYTANLVNGIGNLTSRILTMVQNYEVEFSLIDNTDVLEGEEWEGVVEYIKNFSFNEAMDWLWGEFNKLDEFITTEEPFKTIKTNEEKALADVAYCAIRLGELTVMLQPFLPETAELIERAIEGRQKPDNLFPRK